INYNDPDGQFLGFLGGFADVLGKILGFVKSIPPLPSPLGGSGSGFQSTGSWQTDADRQRNLALLLSVVAAAQGKNPEHYVKYLQLEKDCIMMNNPATGGPTRNRTYQAIGEDNSPIGATIQESVTTANGRLATGIIGDPASISRTGVFNDQLGLSFLQTGTA